MTNQSIAVLEALGLPLIAVEPEVVEATLARVNHRSLARIITALVNENEPLLKAEQDGSTVIVRERGGPAVMLVTVTNTPPPQKGQDRG